MSSAQRIDPTPKLRVAPPDLHLAVWPVRDSGWRAILPVVWVAIFCVIASAATRDVIVGVVTLAAVVLAAWRWWVPVTFDFGPTGIVETIWGWQRRVPWSVIARWEVKRRGVLLLPDRDPSPLDPWRGRYIAWNRSRTELLAILECYLADQQS